MAAWDRELEQTQQDLDRLGPWQQNIRLPNGMETAPALGSYPEALWQLLASKLPNSMHGKQVLDLGCGAGYFSVAMAARGAEVLGLDPSPQALEQARWLRRKFGMKSGIRLRCAPVYAIAKQEGTYDYVLIMGGLDEHRYPSLLLDLAIEKTAGTLAVVASAKSSLHDGSESTHQRDLGPELEAAGLKVRRAGHGIFLCTPESVPETPEVDLLAATGRAWRVHLRH